MSSFPWKNLKAETLRSVCKDLGAGPATPRTREGMIAFLSTVEKHSWPEKLRAETLRSAYKDLGTGGKTKRNREGILDFLRDVEARGSMLPKEGGTPIPETGRTVPVAEIGATSSKPDDDAMDSDDDVDMALLLDVDHSTCEHGCQDGWLSPRTKFVLQVTAAVASDLVRHTGELAGEYGHVGPVYLTNFLPAGITPRGKKAAPLWVEAFAVLFEVIADIFKAGKIPTADLLEQTIARDKGKKKHFDVYRKQGADCEQLLQALVYGAKYEWEENDFAEAHCSEEWEALPACKKHDFDWGMAEDVLSA